MSNSIRHTCQFVLLIAMCLTLAACKGSVSVFGNLTSMLIATVLLWSTLNINQE